MINPSYQRALILHQQGRHLDAANELRQSLANNPHDPHSHAMLAICLTDLQKFGEAANEAQNAIGLAPQLPFAHFALARVMYHRHFYDDAVHAISQAIALDPFRSEFHALLGFIRFEQNKWPSALESAERGLQIDPEDEACVNLRAMALVKLGRQTEAAAAIEGALAKDPENARSHANQGWTYLHRGDPKQAMVHFKEALRIDPTLDWARAGMVEALKAKNFVYRWLLRYFLFMSRLNRRAAWGIVIGGYVGYRVAFNLARTNPSLAPWLWPIVIAYIAFALLTWFADPLLNLALRLHPQGKYALSRDQRMGATGVGLTILASIGCLILWLKTGEDAAFAAALMLFFFVMPLSGIFKCPKGWPRWAMLAIAVALFTVMCGSVILELAGPRLGERAFEASWKLFLAYLYGVLISQFATGYLMSVRPRL